LEDNLEQTHKKPIPPIAGLVDFQSKANALRDGLFPDSAEPSNIPDNFVSSTNDLTQNFYPVTKRKINICLRNLNTVSAPGDDKLTYGVVQHFNNSLPYALLDLFTALFQYKCFPQEWKHANCIIIQKQGRAKQGDPKGYRPISLLSCMGKIFEKIAAKRIATAGVQCGAIANNQIGGQAQNSAIDAGEIPKPFKAGLPQGSPASPILFLIYANATMNPMIHINDDLESECTYIDDISMVQAAINTDNVIFHLKTRSEIQIDRAKILYIRYSPDKSDLMFYFPTSSAFTSELQRYELERELLRRVSQSAIG
jgi:hypothetical protein